MPSRGSEAEASLSARLAAGLIDAAIVAIVGGVVAKGVGAALVAAGFSDAVSEPVRKLVLLGVFAGYCVLLTAGPGQATWGQRWLGLRVLGAAGGRPTRSEALGRWLAFLAAALPLGAGLLIGLGHERRPFQDRLCDSQVVRRDPRMDGGSA